MKLFLSVISCILTFTLIGCTSSSEQVKTDSNSQKEELAKFQEENKELQQEITVQSEKINSTQAELDAYKNFISNDLINTLNKQQLQSLAEKQWKYQLFIDEKEINETNDLEIFKSELEIRLVETQNPFTVLPIEIHNKGQLSSHIRKHINISPSNYEMIVPAGSYVDSVIYKFENVSSDTIELTITDELKDRLGIDKNTINIDLQ